MARDASDMPPHGSLAHVNGTEIYYETHGQGDPLVLLHGFFGSTLVWERYLADLSARYRVIAVDLRGHGRSTNPTGQFTHRQAALDVFALMDHLQIDRFKAMGTSTGAMTLIHMATQQPERVEAMVLLNGTIYFLEQTRAILRRHTVDSPEIDWGRLRERHKHGDDQIRALINQFNRFKDSYDDMNFTPPYLSTITARTLIVHGDRDPFFPISIPVEMYGAIPDSYLWVVPNWGHGAPHGHSDSFFSLFLETAHAFLGGVWDEAES